MNEWLVHVRPVSMPEDQKTKWIIYSLHFSTWMVVVIWFTHQMNTLYGRQDFSAAVCSSQLVFPFCVVRVFCAVRTNASVKSEFYLQASHKFRMMHQNMGKMECKVKLLMLYALPLSSICAPWMADVRLNIYKHQWRELCTSVSSMQPAPSVAMWRT